MGIEKRKQFCMNFETCQKHVFFQPTIVFPPKSQNAQHKRTYICIQHWS